MADTSITAQNNGQSPAPADTAAKPAAREPSYWQATPELDVYESAEQYLIVLDVPGAAAESVDVQVEGTQLAVRAQQAPAAGYTDVALARYRRTIELPSTVDASSASAQLSNGVLEIRIQKSAAARRVKIPVNGSN